MDERLFLQLLCDMPLEEGQLYIQAHLAELADHACIGNLIKDESLRQESISPSLALKLADLLIYFGNLTGHIPSHALGLIAKGNIMKNLGKHQAALQFSDEAGAEFMHLGDEIGWARSRISWIVSAAWLGRAEEALAEATRAREIFLKYDELYRALTVDHNIALVYLELGRYQESFELYEKILSLYSTLDKQSEFVRGAIALAKLNQGVIMSWMSQFAQAYTLLQQARADFAALGQTNSIISVDLDLVDIDYLQGYYGSALRRCYQLRDTALQHDLFTPMRQVWIMYRMARCLVKLDRPLEAGQLVAQAIEISKQFDSLINVGYLLSDYVIVLRECGQLEEALNTLIEAIDLFTHSGFHQRLSTLKLLQAELLLEMGFPDQAYAEAKFAQQSSMQQHIVPLSVSASFVMIRALIEKARSSAEDAQSACLLSEAGSLCELAAAQARQHNLQELIYRSQHLLGRIATIQGDSVKATNYYEDAIVQVEQMLNDLVYDLSSSFLRTTWTLYEDMMLLRLQQGQIEQALGYLERVRSIVLRQHFQRARSLYGKSGEQDYDAAPLAIRETRSALLRTQHEFIQCQQEYRRYTARLAQSGESDAPLIPRSTIQAELARCEMKLSELFERLQLFEYELEHTPQTFRSDHENSKAQQSNENYQVDLTQLRNTLAPDHLLLAYFMVQKTLIIFVMTREALISRELPGGAEQLECLLPLLHAHLQPGGWPDPQNPPQQTIRRLLKKLYDLLIAPVAEYLPSADSPLTIVPYGPLHTLPFHALHDGTHFLVEKFQINYLPASSVLTKLDSTRAVPQTAAITSPLIFGYSDQGQLPRALEEARTLAAMLEGSCYLEDEATIERLLQTASGSPIIHLATHGNSRLDAPNFSSILLADGSLTALDAFRLTLTSCQLVTLSGCETGLALSGGGDEQLGLGRAFLAAGAASLVISLWPVDDDCTSELMQHFYRRLLEGESKVQSLRTAQRALLQQPDSPYAHPYYWASFRLVGESGPLCNLLSPHLPSRYSIPKRSTSHVESIRK